RLADDFLLIYRIQHPLHSDFHILDGLIDHSVQPEVYALLLRNLLRHCVRTDTKSNDNGGGRSRKRNVGFIYRAHAAMDHTDYNFIVVKFHKALFNRFHRSLYVRLDNDRKFLEITRLDLIEKIIQRKFALGLFQKTVLVLRNKGSSEVL